MKLNVTQVNRRKFTFTQVIEEYDMIGIGIGTIFRKRGISWSSSCAPLNLILVDIVGGIRLTWDDVCSDEDGFEIWVSINGGAYALLDTVAADVETYDDMTDYSGQPVEYKIRAYKGTSYSEYSTESTITPNPIYDGHSVFWFDAQDLTTVTKDGSNLVSQWRCKLGTGHDLNYTPTYDKGVWSVNGILFPKTTNQHMKTAAFTWNQPEFIYLVMKQVTWTSMNYIIDGNTAATGAIIQYNTTPKLWPYAGAGSTPEAGNLAVNTLGIIRVRFNGATSKLQINGNAAFTGNIGAANMGGFNLAKQGGGTSYSNIQVQEIIGRNVDDSAGGGADETYIYNYLKAKYGL